MRCFFYPGLGERPRYKLSTYNQNFHFWMHLTALDNRAFVLKPMEDLKLSTIHAVATLATNP